MSMLVGSCKRWVSSGWFEKFILGVIVFNGIVIGLETSPSLLSEHGALFANINHLILGIFVLEAGLKMAAEAPRPWRYFQSGWNIFDFTIIVLSFLPTGEFATTARLIRLLRVARLITAVSDLRVIIGTLLRSLPGLGHIVILLALLFYIYGVMGYFIFHTIDPQNWGSLGSSLLTLFGIVTLEGWVEKMGQVLPHAPWAWVYFVSFIVLGTFTFVNLFVAVIINNLSEAKRERLEELEAPMTHHELLKELQQTKDALTRLEAKLRASSKL